jgi:DNA-binding FadR family transcriptional regulator
LPQPARPQKRSQLIADVLQAEIIRGIVGGAMHDGDQLPSERDLMERFAVARPTLREAMRFLEAAHLVELRVGQRGGAYVKIPHADVAARHVAILLELRGATVGDVWKLRALLEPLAVRFAGENVTKAAIADLRAILETTALKLGDTEALASQSLRFFDELVCLAGNETITVLCAVLHDLLETQGLAYARTLRLPPAVDIQKWNRMALRAMEKLVDLLDEGDIDQAEAYWRSHMTALTSQHDTWYRSAPLVDAMAFNNR